MQCGKRSTSLRDGPTLASMEAACSTSVAHLLYVVRPAIRFGADVPHILQFTAPLLGEPLNVILSGLSDPYVLTEEGFREYTKSSLSRHSLFVTVD